MISAEWRHIDREIEQFPLAIDYHSGEIVDLGGGQTAAIRERKGNSSKRLSSFHVEDCPGLIAAERQESETVRREIRFEISCAVSATAGNEEHLGEVDSRDSGHAKNFLDRIGASFIEDPRKNCRRIHDGKQVTIWLHRVTPDCESMRDESPRLSSRSWSTALPWESAD